MIGRRRFALAAVAAAVSATGAALLVRGLWGRDLRQAGAYAPLLEELLDDERVRAEIDRIGRAYLQGSAGERDPLRLLREVAPTDPKVEVPDAGGVVAQLRTACQAAIARDLDRGALLRLEGYFVPESLAKLCAATVLALQDHG